MWVRACGFALVGVVASAIAFGAPAIGHAATIQGLGGPTTGASGTTSSLANLIAAESQELLAIEQAASTAIADMGNAEIPAK